jgi:adenylosuccinate synthase
MISICCLLVSFIYNIIFLLTLYVGLINPNCIALIGNGVVVHLPSFFEEKAKLEAKGKSFKQKV